MVGGDAVECFSSEIVGFRDVEDSCRNSLCKLAGIVDFFARKSPKREKETSAFTLQELTFGGITEVFVMLY